jgi:hypothetical protein
MVHIPASSANIRYLVRLFKTNLLFRTPAATTCIPSSPYAPTALLIRASSSMTHIGMGQRTHCASQACRYQKSNRKSSNIRPPQTMNARMPWGELAIGFKMQIGVARGDLPTHNGDIGDLNFCFCFMADSGFPRFIVSRRAYRSLAFRCCGVCAWWEAG